MNLKETERGALLFGGDLRRSQSGALTLTLADRDSITFAPPTIDTTSDTPDEGEEGKEPRLQRRLERNPIGREVNRCLWSVLRMAHEAHRVGQDARYTEAGRADVLREPIRAGAMNIADASRCLDDIEVSLIERTQAMFAVPRLAPHDSVGASLDREARDYVRGLKGPELEAMMVQLHRGEAEGVTLALLRSPVPFGNMETVVRQVWRSAIERRNPEAVQQIAAETEHLEASRLLMKRAAAKFAEKAKLGGFALFEAAACQLTLPNGPSVFFPNPGEFRQHRVRWHAMQQKAA